MLLVDEAVMYESSALNKNLTCQMSPLIISFPSRAVWCEFSFSVWHCTGWCFGGNGVPACAHLQAVYCFKSWLQSSVRFSIDVRKIVAVISFALNVIGKIIRAVLAPSMFKIKQMHPNAQVNELWRRHHPFMQIICMSWKVEKLNKKHCHKWQCPWFQLPPDYRYGQKMADLLGKTWALLQSSCKGMEPFSPERTAECALFSSCSEWTLILFSTEMFFSNLYLIIF